MATAATATRSPTLPRKGRGRSRSEGTPAMTTAPHYGQEEEEGNREHKFKLVQITHERLTHLTTQLNWRLNESTQGEAVYLLGVRDDGFPEGISDVDFRESLRTLRAMAKGVHACVSDIQVSRGVRGKVAKILLKREEVKGVAPHQLRIAVLGGVDSGKSTTIGVITKGKLDNGRGLARMQVFRHNHEVENGRTSSISQHMLGFRADGSVANYRPSHDLTAAPRALSAEEIQQQSAKVVSFIDLAGDERYMKTTLSGMVGLSPDYAMISIPASASSSLSCAAAAAAVGTEEGGTTSSSSPDASDTEEEEGVVPGRGRRRRCSSSASGSTSHESTSKPLEHLDIALALDVPMFLVLTKADTATEAMVEGTLTLVQQALHEASLARREIYPVRSEEDLETALEEYATHPPASATTASVDNDDGIEDRDGFIVPVFVVSNVTGVGLDLLRRFIQALPRSRAWDEARQESITEVHIDDSFDVEGVGCVLAGAIHRGKVTVGDRLLLGPDRSTGAFEPVVVRSIHLHRVPVRSGAAGQCVSLSFASAAEGEEAIHMEDDEEDDDEAEGPRSGLTPQKNFKGTVLVSPSVCPTAACEFQAELVVLNDAQGPLSCNQEPSVHIYTSRQTAKLLSMDDGARTTASKGETVRCRFRFLFHAEYVCEGMTVVVRSGKTIAVGRVL